MNAIQLSRRSLFLLSWGLILSSLYVSQAQSTAFTYQGRLTDAGVPANGNYEMQFTLFDSVVDGAQIGSPVTVTVTVANGISTAPPLDFGAEAFVGAARYLEIGVRPPGSPNPFTILSPRQPILSTPYGIRSLSAATADNSTQLGGVDSSRFVQQDAGGNVNIAGGLTVGGSFSLDTVNAQTQYNLGGQRILSNAGNANLFVGTGTGASNSGIFNTFVGTAAGYSNTTGNSNSFFGVNAGLVNTSGANNSFFGDRAGSANTTGDFNSFFGFLAGLSNTTGLYNTLLGAQAGDSNTTGNGNTYVGTSSGAANQSGNNNSFFGLDVGRNNTASDNSFFGAQAGRGTTTGDSNAFFGSNAGQQNSTGRENAFFGATSGTSNTTGVANSVFGSFAAGFNTAGSFNSFFGRGAGFNNNADFNAFFGAGAGELNTTGTDNTFVGTSSGGTNVTGSDNAFFGREAGRNNTGSNNTFFGYQAGRGNTIGNNNMSLGAVANVSENNLTNAAAIGANALVSSSNAMVLGGINGVNFATADTNVGIGTSSPVARLNVVGSSWFQGDTTPLPNTAGKGIVIGFSGELGYISSFDYGSFTPKTLLLNNSGGNVGIGTNTPKARLDVTGGNIIVGSPGQGIILKSPNGATCRLLSIDNAGAMVLTAVACP